MTTAPTLNGNGQPKGRAVPDQATFTFANGATATLKPVSQFTQAHIEIQARKKLPPPQPPMNEVDYGDGKKVREPNAADPDYVQALQRYQMELSFLMFDALIELGVEIEVDQEALERVKRPLAALGIPLDEASDKVAYIKHCCMFNLEKEGAALRTMMQSLTGPKEEDVQDHIATFSDHVPGA